MKQFLTVLFSYLCFSSYTIETETIARQSPPEVAQYSVTNVYRHDFFIGDYLYEQKLEELVVLKRKEALSQFRESLPDPVEVQLGKFLSETNLYEATDEIINVAQLYNIPVPFFVAIIAHETGWGSSMLYTEHNNPGGIKANERTPDNYGEFASYATIEDGLLDKAWLFTHYYFERGLTTLTDIQPVYCPSDDAGCENWVMSVYSIMTTVENELLN